MSDAPGALTRATVMTGRSLLLSRRNTDAVITSMMLPIMLMLIFVYFFGGPIDTGAAYDSYVMYVVPGVLFLCAGFGSATTAVAVSEDMKGGIIDRFRSLDVGGMPILAGHVVTSTVRNLVSTALVFAVAVLIGFRPADPRRLARRRHRTARLHRRPVLDLRGDRPAGPHARSGRRVHLLHVVPALPEQRVRPGRQHAGLAPRLRRPPAGHPRHRIPPGAPPGPAGGQHPLDRARVGGGNPAGGRRPVRGALHGQDAVTARSQRS